MTDSEKRNYRKLERHYRQTVLKQIDALEEEHCAPCPVSLEPKSNKTSSKVCQGCEIYGQIRKYAQKYEGEYNPGEELKMAKITTKETTKDIAEIAKLTEQLNKSKDDLSKRGEHIELLKKENNDWQLQNGKLQSLVESRDKRIADLEKTLAERMEQYQDAENKVRALNNKCDFYKDQIETLQKDNRKCDLYIEALEKQVQSVLITTHLLGRKHDADIRDMINHYEATT